MKRVLTLALAAALLAAVTLPSAAEETPDSRLAKVTQAVKSTLDLDTEGFENFDSGVSEDLTPYWDLNWRSEGRSLTISALEDGTILSLYRWENEVRPAGERYDFPTFPDRDDGASKALARDFLDRVLRPGETVELKDPQDHLDVSEHSWSGTIVLNGLPSPLSYSISVKDGRVERFNRDVPETVYINSLVGGVPSPEASADKEEAAKALLEKQTLRLEYVLEKPGGTRAVLRYVPEDVHSFCVDAKTGELIDLTELAEKLYGNSAANDSAAAKAEMSADEAGLTEAEQAGIRELEGVLAKEALDKAVRAESAYGLRGYALTSAVYQKDSGEKGGVSCTLRYARTENGERLTRSVTVDAKTGEVQGVWSSAPWGREKQVTEDEALEAAQDFLKRRYPDRALTLYQKDSSLVPWRTAGRADWQFSFAQEVNGLPFRSNSIYVGIDSVDGSVCSLSSRWEEAPSFEDPSAAVTMETALSAWAGTYETVLAYRQVPQALNKADPIQARLLEEEMLFSYALRLTYALERAETYEGVDGKTGRPIPPERNDIREALAYTDLTGSSAKEDIEKLARYGVGFASEQFRPSKRLTQWELVALLYSLQGPAQVPEAVEKDGREDAYYAAYRMGALRPEDRDDGAVLTRSALVKILLDAAGYGPAARLSGVYTAAYTDLSAVPAGELGYAAMAQALGMAAGTYAGDRAATRSEAASMLCRLLERPA